MEQVKEAVLKTLSYADVFDFPLKADEIYRFLIKKTDNKEQITKNKIPSQRLVRLWRKESIKAGKIKERNGFYFLKNREKIVRLRRNREKWSKEKLKIAKKTARFLKIIPFVKMVAVTGALAMENSRKEDDIDFLIVAEKGRIWTTRFLATILVEVFSKRRRPGDKDVADKICLNMFLDEEHLAVPLKERDLFSAHEVIQLKPLWERDNTYQKFLGANQWVKKFLPNAITKNKKQRTKNKKQKRSIFNLLSVICYLLSVENVLRHFQLWYMSKRRTTEVVFDGIIRFHPKDARAWVLKEYQKRVNSFSE